MSTLETINTTLLDIINKKHEELHLGADYNGIFSKIKDFEANAIGQIGEEFVRQMCKQVTNIEQTTDETIHDEYDIKTLNGITIEVKTARKGRKTDTFQFNGIEPRRNYNYLLCLGLCYDKVVYRIFKHSDIQYIHESRKYFVTDMDFHKQLVQMNPDNLVSYKLTTSLKEMYSIDTFLQELQSILKV